MPKLSFEYLFRGVGQGLFSHGRLWFAPDRWRFHWVHDCGTHSRFSFLRREIARCRAYQEDDNIGLLILSHFDADHMNGVEELLRTKRVEMVVVPYIRLLDRLRLIAFGTGGNPDFARFLFQPATYLKSINPDNLGRVVFVLPDEPGEGTQLEFGPDSPDKGGWPVAPIKEPSTRVDPEGGTVPEIDPMPDVAFVDGREPFQVRGLWEFLFYNRSRPEMMTSLMDTVRPILRNFLAEAPRDRDYSAFIYALRRAFENVRGPQGERFDANEISLISYAGPILTNDDRLFFSECPSIVNTEQDWQRFLWRGPVELRNGSLLYTGDVTFSDDLLSEILTRFTANRLSRVAVFQVPHHGSRRSWQIRDARRLTHRWSVFSAEDENPRYGHPHPEVKQALRQLGPVYINELYSAGWFGFF